MSGQKNEAFAIHGINHLALVCSDMAKTVDFYSNVLGMPLVKTLEMSDGGQHFFFGLGNGDTLAFFWFPNPVPAAPGVAMPIGLPSLEGGLSDIRSAIGSMNHVAFNVSAERMDEAYERLQERGVTVTPMWFHNDPDNSVTYDRKKETWLESIYFLDPDGIMLEFAAFKRPLDPSIDATVPARSPVS